MIFRQVIDEDLGCASYLVGDGGEAAVVDPSWDIAPYLELAAAHGLRITRVLETHTHADHVSGRGRLVEATGARVFIPAGATGAFAHTTLAGGDVLAFGRVRIEVVPTPGHRPEHVAFLVADRSRADEPTLVLSGDSLLVGDVARPDLASADEREVVQAARSLLDSIGLLASLPDHVELWPGHIGGSLCCAGGVSEKPSSTIGFERSANAGLADQDADRFVAKLLERLPHRPPSVERVVELNRGPLVGPPGPLPALGVDAVERLVAGGACIVDGRDALEFDEESIPGSLCLPLGSPGVGSRAAWLLDPRRPLVVNAATPEGAELLAARLAAVGLVEVRGRVAGGLAAWRARGRQRATIQRVDAGTAALLLDAGAAALVDIRDADERLGSALAGSLNIPWRELSTRADEAWATGRPVIVACASGARTPTAASLLSRESGPPILRLAHGGVAEILAQLARPGVPAREHAVSVV